jgi:DNA-binding beta-propeller fold protein YncE
MQKRMNENRQGAELARLVPARPLIVAILALSLLFCPSASADAVVGPPGSGVGQITSPAGVAVDTTTGLLYVADKGNNRVDVFDADSHAFVMAFGWGVADGTSAELQTCTTTCFKGLAGSGSGQFQNITGVAVDNDSTSPSFGDVFVVDSGNVRIQRFSPSGEFIWMVGGGVNETSGGDLCTAASGDACGKGDSGESAGEFNLNQLGEIGGAAVGPGGILFVGDQIGEGSERKTRIQRFDSSGASIASPFILEVTGGAGRTTGVAVDSTGSFYVGTSSVTGAVRKYNSSGACLNCSEPIDPSFNILALAVDSSDNLYVADNTGNFSTSRPGILQYEPDGDQIRAFYGTLATGARGLAPFSDADGDVYAAESGEGRVLHIPFPPPGPVVYPGASTVFASGIRSKKVILHSEINPEGTQTTYHFEYITDQQFQAAGNTFGAGTIESAETPIDPPYEWADVGVCKKENISKSASEQIPCELHPVETEVTGLLPETLYHFRVVATNGDGGPVFGPEGEFDTKDSIELKDIWASGVNANAALLSVEANPFGTPATGYFEYVDDATYQASGFAAASKAPAGEPLDLGAGETFITASSEVLGLESGTTYHYRFVANSNCKLDPTIVCTFFSDEAILTTLVVGSPSAECPNSVFRKGVNAHLPNCRAYEMVSPVNKNGSSIEVMGTITGFLARLDQSAADGQTMTYSAARAFADPVSSPYSSQYLARRTSGGWVTESISPPRIGPSLYNTAGLDYQFKAFTDDLCGSWLLQDTANLLAPGAIPGYPNLYRVDNCGDDAGTYEPVTTEAPPPGLKPNAFMPELQAFSQDGEKTYFRVGADDAERVYEDTGAGQNQVCIQSNGTPSSGECSLGTNGGSERAGNVYHAVSGDGSRIYWSNSAGAIFLRVDGQQTLPVSGGKADFWGAAEDGSKAIYETSPGLLHEYDATTEDTTLLAEGVQGVAGLSEDASIVYFVSTKDLDTGALAGSPNLYRAQGGDIRFIATLDPVDMDLYSLISRAPFRRISRVSGDGSKLVFMSRTSLTGYDNTDAVSGRPDSEVFLYDDDAAGGVGDLLCVSCNPTGGRPLGRELKIQGVINFWAAGSIAAWETQHYAPRVLSDDGSRIYFNSFDPLVTQDVNEAQDVYQWEMLGAGECEDTDSYGFVAFAGGCVTLISSGTSTRDAEFVDASTTGDDVFFKTASSLVPQDPNLIDVYDARVNGGFPAPPIEKEECAGEACQAPGNALPQGPVPSSTLPGPGNPVTKPTKPKKCPKGRHKVKRKGKIVCVKNKKASKNRRAGK